MVFDGVFMNSTIWVNGKLCENYPSGFSTFYYDITNCINYMDIKDNTIVVKVDNSVEPSARSYKGSGIYRNVWLVIISPAHVEQWAVSIATPKVSKVQATVKISTNILTTKFPATEYSPLWEDTTKIKWITKKAELVNEIVDQMGRIVSRSNTNLKLSNYEKKTIEQYIIIQNPRLWSPDTPNLYKVRTKIYIDGVLSDDVVNPLGIRSLEFSAQKGFLLNGTPTKIKGLCIQQTDGPVGAAVNTDLWSRMLNVSKEAGCNAIRTAHNPFDPEFYDLCDELGFVILNEAFDTWDRNFVFGCSTNPI